MTKHAKGYRVVEVSCLDRTDQPPRRYDAGFTDDMDRDGFRCAKCGELVPVAGNELHLVAGGKRRREPAADGGAS